MLNRVRSFFFWLHLIAGCVGGLIILLMSATGVLLTYERQMIAAADRGPFRVSPPSSSASRLQIEEFLAKAAIAGAPVITLRSDPSEPVEVNLGRDGIRYYNPYTAELLGTPGKATREFFQKLRGWHRWIALEGENRAIGKAITGACTLAFLGIVLTGLYLWIPRFWSWQHLRPILWFRGGVSGKARDFNWHNALGIWSAVPLFFIILSALPISYPWANALIYQVTGTEMPRQGGESPRPPKADPDPAGLNQLVEVAARQPGWQSIAFRIPAGDGPVSFTVDRGDGGQPQLRATLLLDRSSGSVIRNEDFASFNLGRRIRMYSRFLHTGESLGIIGQTLAGIASLAAVVLVWTGIALALRRFSSWRRRRVAVPAPEREVVTV